MFDLRESFNSILHVSYSWFYFGLQFFAYGAIITKLVVSVNNYFIYFGAGLIILSSFNIASWAGRRFVEFAHEGRLKYLLSLPISRRDLFLEQVMHGVIVNMIRMAPPLAAILFVSNTFSPLEFAGSLLILAMSAVGIMGLMVSLSVIAFRSFDIYSAIVAALSALLVRFSTINYPLEAMTEPVRLVSSANPLTYASDLFRAFLGINTDILADPVFSLFVLIALVTGTLFLGMYFMASYIEGVKSS
jgi:ABC-type polysaccharide/polyol phosphate export permease